MPTMSHPPPANAINYPIKWTETTRLRSPLRPKGTTSTAFPRRPLSWRPLTYSSMKLHSASTPSTFSCYPCCPFYISYLLHFSSILFLFSFLPSYVTFPPSLSFFCRFVLPPFSSLPFSSPSLFSCFPFYYLRFQSLSSPSSLSFFSFSVPIPFSFPFLFLFTSFSFAFLFSSVSWLPCHSMPFRKSLCYPSLPYPLTFLFHSLFLSGLFPSFSLSSLALSSLHSFTLPPFTFCAFP